MIHIRLFATSTIFGIFTLLASQTLAAIIEAGSLSRAADSPIIVDRLNNRQWLAWDVTRWFDYAETVEKIGAGGEWQGFKIARNSDAQMFVNALIGLPNNCDVVENDQCSYGGGPGSVWESLVGETFYNFRESPFNYHRDDELVWFLSDNQEGEDVGYIAISSHDTQYYPNDAYLNYVSKYNEWGTFDQASAYNTPPQAIVRNDVGWLLYRVNPVPEPATIPMLALGSCLILLLRRF